MKFCIFVSLFYCLKNYEAINLLFVIDVVFGVSFFFFRYFQNRHNGLYLLVVFDFLKYVTCVDDNVDSIDLELYSKCFM